MQKIRCALLTSGGDSPGMNKIIYDLCYLFQDSNIEIVLIKNGLKGLYNNQTCNFSINLLNNISNQPSSVIGTSRFSAFQNLETQQIIKTNIKNMQLDKLIIVGGDGSFEASKILMDTVDIIFIPATIDNDFFDNHLTLGYYSCLEYISRTIFNISLSAKAHEQVHMIELMGNGSNELIVNAAKIHHNVVFIDSLEKYTDKFKNMIYKKYKKENYLVILLKEKIMSENQKNSLLDDISLLLGNKVRLSVLGYAQRSCEISVNDLIYSSVVSKYIFKNIYDIKNVIVSYSSKDSNDLRVAKIPIK